MRQCHSLFLISDLYVYVAVCNWTPVIPRVYEFCIESPRIRWTNVIAGGLVQSQPEEKLSWVNKLRAPPLHLLPFPPSPPPSSHQVCNMQQFELRWAVTYSFVNVTVIDLESYATFGDVIFV
jgi:hypothetical protein